jgi:hypothetical protein
MAAIMQMICHQQGTLKYLSKVTRGPFQVTNWRGHPVPYMPAKCKLNPAGIFF